LQNIVIFKVLALW